MNDVNKQHTCCFIGHRHIDKSEELKNEVCELIENLIVNEGVNTFLLGSKSKFNDLCKMLLCSFKEKYPHITRIYVRAEFPYIDDSYKDYLLQWCDDTYYPERMIDAGRAAYVERNYEMIEKSDYCVVYFDESYAPAERKNSKRDLFAYQPKSGTKIAYDYAVKKCRKVINVLKNKEDTK